MYHSIVYKRRFSFNILIKHRYDGKYVYIDGKRVLDITSSNYFGLHNCQDTKVFYKYHIASKTKIFIAIKLQRCILFIIIT